MLTRAAYPVLKSSSFPRSSRISLEESSDVHDFMLCSPARLLNGGAKAMSGLPSVDGPSEVDVDGFRLQDSDTV
jgi:hypothetical protein